ncbi:SMEK domain-containing protein [Desulfobacula phenolica]|uniref:SMEK domain-containing protein n=1 Tax=Desulfobacula phenolica TaxID=90732 RepID=A0A1H2IDS8_9BACT|nr:SMEK domain-containing protein [Desulfobacula phenolica]SDU42096.1 hypothetical protein SAMN04487931_10899 [Desulfobacula phenolica]
MYREDYINGIIHALAFLSRKVDIKSSLNLTDLNVHAEDFYKDFLNKALGYNLININTINQNAVSIDLGDSTTRIAIQVTSTSALAKTRRTVKKFIENRLYREYDRLIILNLVKTTRHKDPFIGDADIFQIDTKKDMWDYKKLARIIAGKETLLLKDIYDFLHRELKLVEETKLPKEVQTIIALIDHLSNGENPDAGNCFIEDPDPEGKINNRFADHAEFLTQSYTELYAVYGPNIETIKDQTDIGTVQIAKKSLYLKTYSDNILTKCNNNPKMAIDKLIQELSNAVGQKGIEYDETAIRFFLIDELTRCNVFPNSEVTNA